jgi:branched-chain amino acid transport system permease protein
MRQAGFLRDAAIAATVLAVLLAVPVVLPSKAILDFGIRGAAMALFATSLNLLVGYTGLVSFGHGMFYGLGTYAFALLMQRTAFSLPLAFLATLGITALTAAAVGAICIRLRTIYFAFVTLAMQMLLYSVIISWVDLTGGDQGMMGGIPRRVVGRVDFGDHATLYAASCIALMLGMLLMRHIVASPFGASLRMIRDNEPRAAFLGITVWRMKLSIFVLSSVFAATGG